MVWERFLKMPLPREAQSKLRCQVSERPSVDSNLAANLACMRNVRKEELMEKKTFCPLLLSAKDYVKNAGFKLIETSQLLFSRFMTLSKQYTLYI